MQSSNTTMINEHDNKHLVNDAIKNRELDELLRVYPEDLPSSRDGRHKVEDAKQENYASAILRARRLLALPADKASSVRKSASLENTPSIQAHE